MARAFGSLNSDEIEFASAPASWAFGTLAVAWNVSLGNNTYRVPISAGTASADEWVFGLQDANHPFWYNGSDITLNSVTVGVSDGWFILAMTKATGTTTPRFHHYRWSTNTWTHGNGSGTNANPSASTSFRIGTDINDESAGGALAAAMLLNGEVMTDGECERLHEGLWDRWCDDKDALFEFRSGRDRGPGTAVKVREYGRLRLAWSNTTGTTRAAVADPPGFRFSRCTRRR